MGLWTDSPYTMSVPPRCTSTAIETDATSETEAVRRTHSYDLLTEQEMHLFVIRTVVIANAVTVLAYLYIFTQSMRLWLLGGVFSQADVLAWDVKQCPSLSRAPGAGQVHHGGKFGSENEVTRNQYLAMSVKFGRNIEVWGLIFTYYSYEEVWLNINQTADSLHSLNDLFAAYCSWRVQSSRVHQFDYACGMITVNLSSVVNLFEAAPKHLLGAESSCKTSRWSFSMEDIKVKLFWDPKLWMDCSGLKKSLVNGTSSAMTIATSQKQKRSS